MASRRQATNQGSRSIARFGSLRLAASDGSRPKADVQVCGRIRGESSTLGASHFD